MARFAWIIYTKHALQRMEHRRISRDDVEAALELGEGAIDEDDNLIYQLQTPHGWTIRVVVADEGETARVITAMRLRKST